MATPTSLPASFSAGNVLTASQMNDLRGAFRVLQVVSDTESTQVDSVANHTDWRDVNLSATITPSATSNKVLITANVWCFKSNGDASNAIGLRIMRGATAIQTVILNLFNGVAQEGYANVPLLWLDSPSTTSATTYKIQFNNFVNAAFVRVNGANVSAMTLQEISA